MAITKLVSPSTPNPTGTGAGASWDLAMAQLTAVRRFLANKCSYNGTTACLALSSPAI